MARKACVIGANRGIGFEFVVQLLNAGYEVMATCRKPEEAKSLQDLSVKESALDIYQLDVCSDEAIEALDKKIGVSPIDRLILNAGISGDRGVRYGGDIERSNLKRVFDVNTFSPLKVAEFLMSAVLLSDEKLIVGITSKMGSIADNHSGGSYAYRGSKAALNAMLYAFALDAKAYDVHLLLLHPGWVKTAMGGSNALIDVQTSVNHMMKIMAKARDYPTGKYLDYAGQAIDW